MCLCGIKKIKIIFGIFFTLAWQISKSAKVDTVSIYSNAMHKPFNCVVIKPDNYKKKRSFPVLYLLHGSSGDYSNWIKRVPAVKRYADEYDMLIVCPDGRSYSWYLDSPVDSSMKFETYIGTEVPAYIDSHYSTIKDRRGRAVAGLSMGGHGSLFLAFRHAAVFGACGSMSGLVDLYSSRSKYELIKRIGDTVTNAENWKKFSAINFIESYPKDSLAIIIDCGTDDVFYSINRQLHEKMLQLKIPHDYIERPGQHDWNYWANAIEYQLVFFKKYFDKWKARNK
jgi:S-formylglutathione hydrolase FrmB